MITSTTADKEEEHARLKAHNDSLGNRGEERGMQPPNDTRRVLVICKFSSECEIALYSGLTKRWIFDNGNSYPEDWVKAWCELPATIEQGARLIPNHPEITEAILGAVWACEQSEGGITPDDAKKIRAILSPLDKPA